MPPDDDAYIIEYITLGNAMKVTALDPSTLTEASIIAPPGMVKSEAAKLAVRKLHYMLDKKQESE